MLEIIKNEILSHQLVVEKLFDTVGDDLLKVIKIIINSLKNGKKIILFGNGGSAADAQHIAAEFVCKFKRERKALSAIALTTDTSILTAISNDYDFERIFERQVEAIAKEGDILIGISTSGNSKNILKAFELGKELNCIIIGLSGSGGGLMNEFCDFNLIVPENNTARIQEMHILLGHIICQIIDDI